MSGLVWSLTGLALVQGGAQLGVHYVFGASGGRQELNVEVAAPSLAVRLMALGVFSFQLDYYLFYIVKGAYFKKSPGQRGHSPPCIYLSNACSSVGSRHLGQQQGGLRRLALLNNGEPLGLWTTPFLDNKFFLLLLRRYRVVLWGGFKAQDCATVLSSKVCTFQ